MPAADGGMTLGATLCSSCAARLPANAAFCGKCGQPVAGPSSAGLGAAQPSLGGQSPRPAARQLSQYIAVTGPARVAGWLVVGGGAALVLSSFLPWVSVFGLVSTGLPTQWVLAFLAVGIVLAYLGIRALLNRVTHAVMVTLWVLAALAALVALIIFVSGQYVGSASYGTVSLSSGFYIGLIGLLATVAGTIVLQTTRKSPRTQVNAPYSHPQNGPR